MAEAPLGVLLLSSEPPRMHAAWMLASTAAALGRQVTVFMTGEGVRDDVSAYDGVAETRGVAGIGALRTACAELGVRIIACESALRLAGIDANALPPDFAVAGMATFLAEVGSGQIVPF